MKKFHSSLFEFAYFPQHDVAVKYLADKLADPEPWEFSDVSNVKYSILKNYLEHIFRKIKQEGKVAYTSSNEFACFNTGLVTKNLEEIYAFFQAYKNPKEG